MTAAFCKTTTGIANKLFCIAAVQFNYRIR